MQPTDRPGSGCSPQGRAGTVLAHAFVTVAGMLVAVAWQSGWLQTPAAMLCHDLSWALLALFAWSLWSWWYVTGSWFDPYSLFLCAASVFNAGQAFLDVFGLLNAPAGTNTISVSVSGGTAVEITGGSESLGNVAQWGYIASAYGNNGTASVTSPGSTSGGIMAGFTACGSGVTSAAGPAASRYIVNEDQNTGAGNSAGATSPSTGGPVTMAWSVEDDYWGAIVVEAQPGSSG